MALKIAARYSWTASTLLQFGRQKLKYCDFPSSTLEIKALITKNTEITRNHLTPEIALHLITPACPLWKAQLEDCPFNDPFWGFYWPGGQAVTRFILDNPAVVRGLSVIDIGSGCGASAIASSKCGAKLVIANDIDLVAGTAACMNAALNDTVIEISSEDHFERNEMENFAKHQCPWDVVIIGDLFYDPDMSKRVMTAVKKWSSMGALVLIGDPGRYAFNELTKTGSQGSHDVPCLSLVKQYPLPEHSCLENNGFSHASVWRLS